MALVDLTSNLSAFRSEVSKEAKSTPEASKATNDRNFATVQPITEKLAQMATTVNKQQPQKLEKKLTSTKLDDIRKMVQKDLTLNQVSKYSFINQNFNRSDFGNISTQMVESKFGDIDQREFQSRLNKSDVLVVKQNPGTNNQLSPVDIVVNPDDSSDNIVNPNIQVNSIPQTFDRRGSSPNIITDNNEEINNITNPDIVITRSELSSDRSSESPNIKPKENDASDNISNPNIEVIRPPQLFDRSKTSPNIVINKDDVSDNIENPNVQIEIKPQSFDRSKQTVVINKELFSPLNNIVNPDIALDSTELTTDREEQSPNIITNTIKQGLVKDPNIKVFRIENGTYHFTDESNLNIDESPIKFTMSSMLEKREPPLEVDNTKYNQESMQIEDNSSLNLDTVIKTIQGGRHETPEESGLSIIGTQQVNFFPDSKVKGFVVKAQKGQTSYVGNSEFGWPGKSSAAPTTNFITDTNGKGFTKFQQPGQTQYETESSVFGFTNIPETDFFDVTKKNTSSGFKSFVTSLDTAYKRDTSVFTFKGNSNAAPTVDFFDQNGQSTSQGFTKFTQNLVSFYISDASIFAWKGARQNAPETNFFDLDGKSTSIGFHKFAELYDSKYVPDSSQFDWDGTRNDAPEANFFDLTGKNTGLGFHKFAELLDSKYLPDSSQFDWDGARENAPEVNYFNLDGSNTTAGFHKFPALLDSKYVPDSSQFDWDGTKQNAPEVNYFNLDSSNTTAGFHKFAQLLDSKYVPDSSQFDWDGTRESAPEVNYFNLDSSNTTAGFHKFAQIYDTKYVKDSSIYDFDGTKQDAPTVNYFDLTNKVSTDGFEKFTPSLVTRYIKDSSQYDFDGNSQTAPEVNFFDIQGKHTTKGFERFTQKLVTKYVKDSSIYDFDGTRANAPVTNFFPNDKATGFTKLAQRLQSEYKKDISEFTFKGKEPKPINFFQNTNATGFTLKAPSLESEYVKESSKFTFKGSTPEPVNFFPDTQASGFDVKIAKGNSKYEKDISEYTFKGGSSAAPKTNFFPDSNSTGFSTFPQSLVSEYVIDSSRFTFKGASSSAPKINVFEDTNATGFTTFPPALATEFIPDISKYGFKGTRQDAPATNYFNDTPAKGFTILATPLETLYQKETSLFTWNGSRANAPSVNFFGITPSPNPKSRPDSISGFTTLFVDKTQTKYSDSFSSFSMENANNKSPVRNVQNTNFFGYIPYERAGFLVNMTQFDGTTYPVVNPVLRYNDSPDKRLSLQGSARNSTVDLVKYALSAFSAKRFDWSLSTFENQVPTILTGATSGKWNRKTGDRSNGRFKGLGSLGLWMTYRSGTSRQDLIDQSKLLSERIPYLESIGTPSEGGIQPYFSEAEAKLEMEKIRAAAELEGIFSANKFFPSILDALYGKYNLQDESYNVDFPAERQPYIIRGIQNYKGDGWLDKSALKDADFFGQQINQFLPEQIGTTGKFSKIRRWGDEFGGRFDEGIIRGGLLTQIDRRVADVNRMAKFARSTKGKLFLGKQIALQFMNPVVDVDPKNQYLAQLLFVLPYPSTLQYNPVTSLGSGASSLIGWHMPRHGFLPVDPFTNKYGQATINREERLKLNSPEYKAFQDIEPASGFSRDPGGFNRLIGLMKEMLPNSLAPQTAEKFGATDLQKSIQKISSEISEYPLIERLSTMFYGPQSFLGLLIGTQYYRAGHPYLGVYNTAPRLVPGEDISTYPDSAKRETFYGALENKSYAGRLKVEQQDTGGDFLGILRAIGYIVKKGPLEPNEAPPSLPRTFEERMGVQQTTLNKIEKLDPYNPKYEYPVDRITRITENNAERVGSLIHMGPSDRIIDYDSNPIKKYRTANYDQLKRKDGGRSSRFYNDFRGNLTLDDTTTTYITDPSISRFDTRNLDERYGFGFQGAPGEQRSVPFLNSIDYVQSKNGDYATPVEKTIQGQKQFFRGDRINIIDYRRIGTGNLNKEIIYEKGTFNEGLKGADDLVEFYFSGLALDGTKNNPTEVIVFRATFDSITDNHNPSWSPVKYMGRADPLYIYNSYERDISFGFVVHIGSRDEMKASWRKLNYLASWTAPKYTKGGAIKGPMCRLNIGNLYRKMPGYISSLSYTFDNQNGTWETAGMPEDTQLSDASVKEFSNPGVLQLPKTINVSVGFVPVGVYRPEWDGVMYSLFDDSQTGNNIENGLIPRDPTRVNYFNEYEKNGAPWILSGTDEGPNGTRLDYSLDPTGSLVLPPGTSKGRPVPTGSTP